MKAKYCVSAPSIYTIGRLLVLSALLFPLLVLAPALAHAATSANATIFNEVTVGYTSGTQTYSASADVTVTVTTLPAAPTVTVDTTAQTTAAGGSVDYIYTIRSNANGPDTYTLTTPVMSANAGVSAPTNTPDAASITLWGGIVVGSGGGYVELPGGSLAVASLSEGDTIELTVGGLTHRYTVAAGGINNGSAQVSGSAEVYAQLTLTPDAGDPNGPLAITGNVNAGEQIGEYDTITLTQVAGVPTTMGTDGTHVTNLTFTTTATDSAGATVSYTTIAGNGNEVTTTVTSPALDIEKAVRNVTTGTAFVTGAGTTARPGEVIEYRITVTNTHATAAVSAVSVSDVIPDYTILVTGPGPYVNNEVQITTTVGGVDSIATATAAADADVATISGSNLTVNIGTGATSGAGGTIQAGDSVVILFQVEVDNT